MPRDGEGDYEVGYGKPPRHTRFMKGQSGNPRGGRRAPRIFRGCSMRRSTSSSPSPTTADGPSSANARQSSPSSSTSRPKPICAIKILFDFVRDIERETEPISPQTAEFSQADEKVLEQLRACWSKGET